MASTGTPTPNYGLNQWRSSDIPERVDFNEDNKNIDKALDELNSKVTGALSAERLPAHNHTAGDITSGRLSQDRMPTSAAANRVLRVGAADSNPVWGQVNLATDVTGILPIANISTQGTQKRLIATLTISQTWIVPIEYRGREADIFMVAGGGSGFSPIAGAGGGGGGGGGTRLIRNYTLGTSHTVTVGTGGASGGQNNGGNTIGFGVTVIGGKSTSSHLGGNAGGPGGSGGGSGGNASMGSSTTFGGSLGGSGSTSHSGIGGGVSVDSPCINPYDGIAYGCGGGGGGNNGGAGGGGAGGRPVVGLTVNGNDGSLGGGGGGGSRNGGNGGLGGGGGGAGSATGFLEVGGAGGAGIIYVYA